MRLTEIRDTSRDVDDPNASMTDPEWHKKYIETHSSNVRIKVGEGGSLIFDYGYFSSFALNMLLKPTMKGFWVPVIINQGAFLDLENKNLIGLSNCASHVTGKISLASDSLRSFELIPIQEIRRFDISECCNLLSLEGMPSVHMLLKINDKQLKKNLKNVFMSCGSGCEVQLFNCSLNMIGSRFLALQDLITSGLARKLRKPPVEALLELQAELIDNDFDEYSDI